MAVVGFKDAGRGMRTKEFPQPLEAEWLRGAWEAQLVGRPTSAQVMISRLVGSSPMSGSVLTARSLEPVLDSVSPSLSAPDRKSVV